MADYSSYKIVLGYTGDWSIPQHAHIDATEAVADEVEAARNGQASLLLAITNRQPLDATLTALAGVTTAADTLIYATGADSFGTTPLTAAARSLLDDASTSAMLTTLGAAASSHTHGGISSAGAIGSTADLPIKTTTSGVLAAGAWGSTAGSFCQGNDSRLSDARTPLSHTHGNLTNTGYIGSTAALPIITGTAGIVQAGAWGSTAGTFCQGNDSRLSDARTPLSHTTVSHSDWPAAVSMTEVGYLDGVTSAIQTQLDGKAASSHSHGNISSAGAIGSTANLPVVTTTGGVLTTGTYPFEMVVACSDETTVLTAGTGKVTFRMPRAITLTAVKASLTTAQSGGSPLVTVDINSGGVSILTTKLTIDNAEKTSATAATAAVIGTTSLAADAEITVDIDSVASTGPTAAGLKITLIGTFV